MFALYKFRVWVRVRFSIRVRVRIKVRPSGHCGDREHVMFSRTPFFMPLQLDSAKAELVLDTCCIQHNQFER